MRRLVLASMMGAILCASGARAEELIPYEVQHGESLYGIAARLFDDARQWPQVARLNRLANPSRLQPGQRLLLPASLLKGTAMTARVEYVRGSVRADGTALRIGDAVAEGAALEVGGQGFVSLRLHDGSLLQLQANSRSKLLRLRDLPVAQRRNTLIELDKGRADATVSPQAPGSRFEVKTPLATAGVRGTRFGVSVAAEAMRATADVVEGRVEVQAGRAIAPAAVSAGQGAVVQRNGAPELKPLLPAPDLSGLPERVERVPGPLPLQAAAGVARYRVEVAEDDTYTRVPWSAEGPLPIVLDGLADGRYHVRVRAMDPDDLLGAEATGRLWIKTTPVPPLAQAPSPDEIVVPEEVTITCTDVPQAQAYLLQVADNPRFEPLLRQEQGAGNCRFELKALPVGELYWRVASLAPEGEGRLERGPFSDPSRFVVVPLPVAPRADQITTDGKQVHWAAVEGYRYRVQVATDTGFGNVVQDEEVHGDRFQLSLPPSCAPYALRLQAIDPHGKRSAFSPPRLVGTEAVLCSGDGRPVRSSGGPVQSPR
jgi:hypothetical protein